jgi:hypothetical protein
MDATLAKKSASSRTPEGNSRTALQRPPLFIVMVERLETGACFVVATSLPLAAPPLPSTSRLFAICGKSGGLRLQPPASLDGRLHTAL